MRHNVTVVALGADLEGRGEGGRDEARKEGEKEGQKGERGGGKEVASWIVVCVVCFVLCWIGQVNWSVPGALFCSHKRQLAHARVAFL